MLYLPRVSVTSFIQLNSYFFKIHFLISLQSANRFFVIVSVGSVADSVQVRRETDEALME
jgi:hypothetical protein